MVQLRVKTAVMAAARENRSLSSCMLPSRVITCWVLDIAVASAGGAPPHPSVRDRLPAVPAPREAMQGSIRSEAPERRAKPTQHCPGEMVARGCFMVSVPFLPATTVVLALLPVWTLMIATPPRTCPWRRTIAATPVRAIIVAPWRACISALIARRRIVVLDVLQRNALSVGDHCRAC
jgi:hypothetical protein